MLTSVSMLSRVFAPVLFALLHVAAVPAASATYNYNYGDWDVYADPGTYSPISLGDTLTLNACGSIYFNYYNSNQQTSLCDLASLTSFTLTWKAKLGDAWTHITQTYSGSNAANGLEVTVNTGAGTFFDQAGTYMIGLYVTVANNSWVQLPGGSWGFSNNGGNGYDWGNQSLNWSTSFAIAAPTSVPEPSAALLLLPALTLLARRERRRRRRAVA